MFRYAIYEIMGENEKIESVEEERKPGKFWVVTLIAVISLTRIGNVRYFCRFCDVV